MSGEGINTVHINGKIIHITDLDPLTLCNEWSKLKNENRALYCYNQQINKGWRGLILRFIGIHLSDKRKIVIKGINAKGESIYPD
ncbi:hypothetical protein ABVL22_004264 [Salmonella enterica]